MEQEKKKGKKKGLVILILLLLILAATSATLLLVDPQKLNIFQTETAIDNLSDTEQTLRERLAAEGSDTIEVNESIEIYGGPLIVNGDKVLTGSGELIAMEGIEEDGLLSVSDDAKLEIKGIKLSGNLMVDYILYIAKAGEAIIGDSVDISEAADINVYNNGSLTMAGGRLRKGNVGIRNSGTAVIEDGIVALMNRYLIDNREEGTLEIKGGSFSSSEGYGIYNRGEMTVSDAEISANKLMGLCNLGKATVKNTLVSQNGYHNIINKSRGKLTLENSDITGSSQSGIHNEEDAYAVIRECKFNTNKLGNLHNRGEAEVFKCTFEDIAYSSVLSDGKVATTYIEDTSIINTTSTGHGLLSTNGCKAELNNVTFKNIGGRAIHNKGGHVSGKNIKVDQTGKVAIGNDKYETGAFGSISLKKVEVLTPFVAIINNCDGTFELKDAKLRSTEQTVVRIAAGTMSLEDVAVTGAPAKGTTKFYGVYANGGALNIKDCSIKDTSSRAIQNQKTKMNIDGLSITNTGAAAMGTIAGKEGDAPSIIIANNLTITNAGSNSICNAGDTSKIVVTNSVINPAGGNSIRVLEGILTMENTKIYGSQKDECVAVKVEKKGTATLSKNTYLTNEKGRAVVNEGTLCMQDVTIENCKTVSYGGAIYNNANLELKNSVLTNNVSGANGGAIHSTAASKLTLKDVEMSNNKATGQGGAINLPAGTEEKPGNIIQLTNVTIKNNEVEKYSSGAIYVGKYRQMKVDGADTVMSRNSAVTYGGAIGMGDYAVVTFADGTIQNNESEGGGGAIFLKPSAELTLKNVNIRENEAKAHGGAVYVSAKAKLTATESTLAKNVASKNGDTYKNGGAIHAEAASLIDLNDVELNNNIATGQGGAINLPSGAEDIKDNLVKLTNVTIKCNGAENYSSGAIYVGRYRELEINGDNTLIHGNTSGTYGGAIGAGDYSKVTLNAGTISENKTSNNNAGGGIFVKPNAILTVNGGSISENTASAGGGIYLDETATLTMTGGAVNGNNAENGNGGGIFSAATASLEISNAELSGNSASVQGGAINLNKAVSKEAATKLVLTDVTIKDNTTSSKSSGAIFVGAYRELEINGEKTLISGNNAKTTGGAIGTADKAVVTMNNGTISGNVANAKDGGGAIFLWNASFIMNGGKVSENIAKVGNGGAIVGAGTSSKIEINGGSICNNTAKGAQGGGGIYLRDKAVLTATGGYIFDNTVASSLYGENVYINSGTSVKLGENAKISSVYFGSGNAPVQILGTTLNNPITMTCKSEEQDGILVVKKAEDSSADIKQLCKNNKIVMGTGFDNPSYELIETEQGMAWTQVITVTSVAALKEAIEGTDNALKYIKLSVSEPLSVNEKVSVKNNANIILMGNATLTRADDFKDEFFYVEKGSTLTLEVIDKQSSFVLDGAKSKVVAEKALIYCDGTLNIADGVVLKDNQRSSSTTANTAYNGGAIYLSDTAILNMTGGTISGNQSGGHGGAIHVAKLAQMNLSNVTLSNNTAIGQGGAINLAGAGASDKDSVILLKNIIILNNTAKTKSSGAVYVGNYRQLQIDGNNTLIDKNQSGATGGAMTAGSGAVITMNAGTISGNKANNGAGGAIYLWEATFDMNGGKLLNNTSAASTAKNAQGGAVYASAKSEVSVSNAEISGNTAYRGGAIYLAATTEANKDSLTINNAKIQSNTSSNSAGAIYVGNDWNVEIDGADTLISGNTSGSTAGAITTGAGAKLTMKAGAISGNTAKGGDGAAVYFWSEAKNPTTFTMSGGEISGNTDARTGGDSPNVRAHNSATIQLSGSAKLASVYWQAGVNDIEVTAPLTAENAVTEITYQSGAQEGTVVMKYVGTENTDMAGFLSKFSVTNSGYALTVDESEIKLKNQ